LLKTLLAPMLILVTLSFAVYTSLTFPQRPIVRLATTTSAYDSGLLDALIPRFESKYNIEVRVIAAGSGQALEIARRGDADIVLAHSKNLELEFIERGYGMLRIGLMYNDFLLVGPLNDPAGVAGLKNITEAFQRIAKGGFRFISRADGSGTHNLELTIWRNIGIAPSSDVNAWYIEANRGMGSVLRIADEMEAYTLVDRATWLSHRKSLQRLKVLVEDDPLLMNPYSLIIVSPEINPHVNFFGAIMLASFMVSDEGQKIIEDFMVEGEQLFKPLAQNITLSGELGFPNQAWELQKLQSIAQESHGETISAPEVRRTVIEEILNITMLSLRISLSAVLLGALIGVPLGAILGLKRFKAKQTILRLTGITIRTFVNTLMGMPPVVAGLIVYLLFNRSGPLGFLGLLYTPTAMVITQLILVIPIIVGVTMTAVGSVESTIRERALSLGATERQAAWMAIKEARAGILTAIIVAFGAAISEVGGIMIAGGNIRWVTRTLTTAIVTEIELGNFDMAITLGIILLSIAFAVNLALTIMQTKMMRGLEK